MCEAIAECCRKQIAFPPVCVLTQGVLGLKKSYFEPRYILLLPTQQKYIKQLKRGEVCTPAQMDVAVSRVELYANTNTQRPGFFDSVIPCGIGKNQLVFRNLLRFYAFLYN